MSIANRVINKNSVSALQNAMKMNVYCHDSRFSPNGSKLVDGAIQRRSVQPNQNELAFSRNTDKVGVTKRPDVSTLAGGAGGLLGDPKIDFARWQNRVARIYMPQRKHVHCHSADKTIG